MSIFKDTDRSLASALSTLAGMFPPNGDEIFNENLHWSPIPVHTGPCDQDYILGGLKPCDRYEYEMALYGNTTAYTEIFEKYKTLIGYMKENSGLELNTVNDLFMLFDTLITEKLKGYRFVLLF